MARSPEEVQRDRALLLVRGTTLVSVAGALGLTWLFSGFAEAYFSGRTPAPPQPHVPLAAAPVQKPPKVIQTVVHKPYGTGPGQTVRPPSQAPGMAPAPPPAPVCHSTPSRPC